MNENLRKGRPVVLSLHGIRTRGKWQKDLTRALNDAGFVHEPLDFGFFYAFSLLNPRSRRNRVDWFLEQYTAAIGGSNDRPSIIAHSFGAYLVARTLQIYKQVTFDKVILCGSIVRRDFPWSKIVERKQVSQVLHDYGKLDVWAKLVEWVVSDAGQSGLHGFSDLANGRVVEQCHPEFRHSDYFFKLNYKDNWIPFLNGTHETEDIDLTPAPPSWRFRIVTTLVAASVIAGASYAWHYFNADSPDPTIETPGIVIPPVPADYTSTESNTVAARESENAAAPSPLQVNMKADANCSLQINGQGVGDLELGVTKLLNVESNEINIVCTSLEYPTISDSRSLTVGPERVADVLLQLRRKIDAHESAKKPIETKRSSVSDLVRTAAVASGKTTTTDSKQQEVVPANKATNTAQAPSVSAAPTSLTNERYDQCIEECEIREYSCQKQKEYKKKADEWLDKYLTNLEKGMSTSAWDSHRRYDAWAQEQSSKCLDRCAKRCD